MSLDAMKQALDALESNPDAMVDRGDGHWDFKRDLAITALRDAIEQAQEPVAWMYVNTDGECEQIEYETPPDDPSITPLYTAPRQWQGLTDEDVEEIERWIEFKEDGSGRIPNQKLVRYIEAKLKAKNS